MVRCSMTRCVGAVCGVMLVFGASGCKPCPELPMTSDYGEGDQSPMVVKVGEPAGVRVPIPFEGGAACLVGTVIGPDGARQTAPVEAAAYGFTVAFTPDRAGKWSASIASRAAPEGRSYASSVIAETEPPAVTPCLSLRRACQRVSRAGPFVACDDALFDWRGQLVAQEDGGAFLGDRSALMRWSGASLVRLTEDGGVAASVPSARPNTWSFGAGHLAMLTDDGGSVFDLSDGGLSEVGTLDAGSHTALQLLETGEVLFLLAEAQEFACGTSGNCLTAQRRAHAIASTPSAVWVATWDQGFFARRLVERYTQADGGWEATQDAYHRYAPPAGSVYELPLAPVMPSRILYNGVWGLFSPDVDGGVMTLGGESAASIGSAEDLVWLSGAAQTRIFCAAP